MVDFNHNFPGYTPPTKEVLEWCQNHVNMIADGGVWGLPRSGTIFRVDHKNKQLVLIASGDEFDSDFYATKHVFSHIGWTVVREEDLKKEKPAAEDKKEDTHE